MAPAGRVTFGTKPQLTATVSASNGAGIPTGTVAFLVPGGGPGTPDLGSAELAVSGGVATAGITVDPNQLSAGDNHIVALFSGDNNFDVSSATTTVTVTPLANAAAIAVEVTPNPVYASASAAGVTTWPLTITLTELAGVAATLTKFNISGTDLSVPTYFPKGTAIPARGTLITSISYTNLKPPLNRVLTFGGTDANGNSWSQQITVPFIGPVLQPEIVLSGVPASVQRDPSADPSCQWVQRLNVQELGGYNMQLFKFLAGYGYQPAVEEYYFTFRLFAFERGPLRVVGQKYRALAAACVKQAALFAQLLLHIIEQVGAGIEAALGQTAFAGRLFFRYHKGYSIYQSETVLYGAGRVSQFVYHPLHALDRGLPGVHI